LLAEGMIIGRPRTATGIGEAPHIRAVGLQGVDVRVDAVCVEAAPDNAFAVRREKRSAVVARSERQPLLTGAVSLHDVNLREVSGGGIETFAVFVGKFVQGVSVAQ